MDHLEDNDAHSWAERLDGDYKFENKRVAGLLPVRRSRHADKIAITRETGYNWSILSRQYWRRRRADVPQ